MEETKHIDTLHRRRNIIQVILQTKYRIQGCCIPGQDMNPDLKELYDRMVLYLATHCEHEWVEDWIDVDANRSLHIVYCPLCETTK